MRRRCFRQRLASGLYSGDVAAGETTGRRRGQESWVSILNEEGIGNGRAGWMGLVVVEGQQRRGGVDAKLWMTCSCIILVGAFAGKSHLSVRAEMPIGG